jgi:hypothetical protein
MEWLFHVDLDLAKHRTADEIAKSARIAFDTLKAHQNLKEGDRLIIAAVRPNG